MKNFEELKSEAIKRGIVPGAVIECANDGECGTVADYSEWQDYTGYPVVGRDQRGHYLYAYGREKWAKVITPAPNQQPDTLQPGDGCECSETMQKAILKLAKSQGTPRIEFYNDYRFVFYKNAEVVCQGHRGHVQNVMSVSEFIRRLENMAPPLKMLGDHVYTIEDGHVMLDGNKIPFEHVHKLNAEILNLK